MKIEKIFNDKTFESLIDEMNSISESVKESVLMLSNSMSYKYQCELKRNIQDFKKIMNDFYKYVIKTSAERLAMSSYIIANSKEKDFLRIVEIGQKLSREVFLNDRKLIAKGNFRITLNGKYSALDLVQNNQEIYGKGGDTFDKHPL